MGRITWACATCAEHFTRKYSADRHNYNFHHANGMIVPILDYIVGRASGQYLPTDPKLPRISKKHNPLDHDYTPKSRLKAVSDDIVNTPYPAKNNMYEKPYSSYPISNNPEYKAVDKPPNIVEKFEERKSKYDELKA